MGKERFVTFSITTSVAAAQDGAAQTTTMIDAALKATLPAVGQSADLDAVHEQLRLTPDTWRLKAAQSR